MFLRLEMSLDLFTHMDRLDDDVNLSTELSWSKATGRPVSAKLQRLDRFQHD